MIRVEKKIVEANVLTREQQEQQAQDAAVAMHEKIERPQVLDGRTYRIKPPLCQSALYITINNIVLNPGTPHEVVQPFEIFINSKEMEHFQWIVALTRLISAVFRKGGDVGFLVEQLRSVFDPKGGYFKKGGRFMPSLIAEIGDVLEEHLLSIGIIRKEAPDPHQSAYLKERREQYEAGVAAVEESGGDSFPDDAALCPKCNTKAVIVMDNCLTCLSCGDSKCG